MNKNILLVFFFSVFLVLSITSAGIFISDEWMTAASLRQLDEFHQVKYNEGSYGYFINGTPSAYMTIRPTLMYTLVLPIASLPAMKIFDTAGEHFRLLIVLLWILAGFASLKLLQDVFGLPRKKVLIGYIAMVILSVLNLLLYSDFPWGGIYTPRETISVVITNIFLFGAFMVGAYLITTRIWKEWKYRLFGTISVLGCTSLMFWAGTLKDHMIVATIVIFIAYTLIVAIEDNSDKYLVLTFALIGLLAWTRAEIAIGTAIVSIILICYYRGWIKAALSILVTGISSIPLFINDYIISGNIFVTPFMMGNVKYSYSNLAGEWTSYGSNTLITNIVRTIIMPQSRAIPLITMIPLFALLVMVLPYLLIKRKVILTKIDIILAAVSVGAMGFYIWTGIAMYQQYDTGIFPDPRYYTPVYALLTLLSLSILSRTLSIDVKDAIRKVPVFSLILLVISSGLIAMMPAAMGDQGGFNKFIALVTLAAFAIAAISFVIQKREGKNYNSTILAMLIAIPLVWAIITVFLYTTIKAEGYPQLMPVSEYLYNMIF